MPVETMKHNDTPEEVIRRIIATSPNPAQARPATVSLENMLMGTVPDPMFDLES